VEIGGQRVDHLGERELARVRSTRLGFVFQFHHLLPEFTAMENVMMPLLIGRVPEREARRQAGALLEQLGMTERADHRPGALSGGEQQRVAVARALVRNPRAVLADEPSGNLDRETGDRLHDLLRRLNREKGITVVVVTHNERLAASADRTLRLEGGKLVGC
jgi:lipoprotein-releasing system ATP-binding protein